MDTQLKVIIVEDEAVIAQLIEFQLEVVGHKVVGIAHDSERALDLIHNHRPDLVLLDINILGQKDGIEVGWLVAEQYQIPIIFITALSDLDTINRAKKVRPVSYLIKPYKQNDLIAAISIGMYNFENRSIAKTASLEEVNERALSPLSDREFEILQNIANGLTNDQIAASQYLALSTIKWHTSNIFSKLDVKNRTGAAKFYSDIVKMI